MKILAFGASGQVGQALAKFPQCEMLSRAEADLTDPTACASIILKTDAKVIINAAAYTAVDQAETDRDQAMLVNAISPGAMAVAAASRGIPFLHISTDYVFDGSKNDPWTERDTPNPTSQYGDTKLKGEQAIIAAKGPFVILRTAWVFSAFSKNFVKTMLNIGRSKSELSIVDDQFGGPTSANSIATALMTIAENIHKNPTKTGIYHFCGTPATNWKTFAEAIFKDANMPISLSGIPSKSYPTPAQRPLNSRLDCAKIFDEFGISQPSWRKDLSDVIKELEGNS